MAHIHFIGVGGVGMSGLAQVLLSRGERVSGSDPHENAATTRLRAQGATIYSEQKADNISKERPDVVVATAAIPQDNPELSAAAEAGIPVLSRAEFLGRMMREFGGPRVAVAGTHGKTTTTAMVASVLIAGGLDPTVLVGGEYAAIGGNVRVGQSEAFITEACEAYDSFLHFPSDIAVVTNVEADHLDYYQTEERVFESFVRFLGNVSPGGAVIYCVHDPGARRLMGMLPESAPVRRIAYGSDAPTPGPSPKNRGGATESPGCAGSSSPVPGRGGRGDRACLYATDVRPEGTGCRLEVVRMVDGREEHLGEVALRVPGRHNVLNALAATAVGLEAGVPFGAIADALCHFTGTGRRFEILSDSPNITVVDDYAHHPTEIRATLHAAREAFRGRRLVAVFQPHLYSRTRDFLDQFAEALSGFDAVIVTAIYAAREKPIPGVRAADLIHRIAELAPEKTAMYIPEKRDVVGALDWIVHPGDVVFSIGAGDVRDVAEAYINAAGACR